MEEGGNANYAYQRMINKAAWLITTGRVVRISNYMFYVMGRRNRHIVKLGGNKLACTCPGYKERSMCSHVVAVSAILEMHDGLSFLEDRVRARLQRELKGFGKRSL